MIIFIQIKTIYAPNAFFQQKNIVPVVMLIDLNEYVRIYGNIVYRTS